MAGRRANLVTTLSLDSRKFKSGMMRVRASVAKFGAAIAKNIVGVLAKAMKLLAVGMAAIAAVLAVGVKKALDLGSKISDVAARTGMAVSKVMIWGEALRQAGVESEKLAGMVNKMQKSINDFRAGLSTQVRGFDAIKLSFQDLRSMRPGEQLEEILQRIKKLPTQAQRAGVAMDLLGRSGAALFAVGDGADALEKAIQTLGSQVEIMERRAIMFDRIADIIGGIKIKLQGFFVGVADVLAPQLLKVAEAFDKIDLAPLGRKVGGIIRDLVEGFKKIPMLLWEGLKFVMLKLGELLLTVVDAAIKRLENIKVAGRSIFKIDPGERIGGGADDMGFLADLQLQKFRSLLDEFFKPTGKVADAFTRSAEETKRLLLEAMGPKQFLRVYGSLTDAQIRENFGLARPEPRHQSQPTVGTSALDEIINRTRESMASREGLRFGPEVGQIHGRITGQNTRPSGFVADRFANTPFKRFKNESANPFLGGFDQASKNAIEQKRQLTAEEQGLAEMRLSRDADDARWKEELTQYEMNRELLERNLKAVNANLVLESN